MKKYYLKEDVDFERLKDYGYLEWNDNGSDIRYFKFNELFIIRIFEDRNIDVQKPIGKEYMIVNIKNLIQGIIDAGLVEERDD